MFIKRRGGGRGDVLNLGRKCSRDRLEVTSFALKRRVFLKVDEVGLSTLSLSLSLSLCTPNVYFPFIYLFQLAHIFSGVQAIIVCCT